VRLPCNTTPFALYNTIVAENSTSVASDADIYGTLDATSHNNLFGADETGQQSSSSILLETDESAGLATLGDYGGIFILPSGKYIETHALMTGSRAINGGSDAAALGPDGLSLMQDQRGYDRIIDVTYGPYAGTGVDIGAYELRQQQQAVGDFNGDSHEDLVTLAPQTSSLNIVLGGDRPGSGLWAMLAPGAWTSFATGDFNGDGRDDLVFREDESDEWYFAISDSTQFSIFNTGINASWTTQQVGDFDGDGSDELIGRTAYTADWEVLQFDEKLGTTKENWDGSFRGETDWTLFVGDVNRDGRDDLIGRSVSNGSDWLVDLSLSAVNQPWTFGDTRNYGDWFDNYFLDGNFTTTDFDGGFYGRYEADANSVDTEGPYRELTKTFATVYNNIELELYVGIKKGPDATEKTQSGNPWDQAALLVQRIEDAITAGNLPNSIDPQIVGGRIEVPIEIARDWLGAKTDSAAVNMLAVMDLPAIVGTPVLSTGKVTFDHAWVQVTLPTPSGLQTKIDLDPSWKFKDYQVGIELPTNLFADNGQGLFEEFEYLEESTKNNIPSPASGSGIDQINISAISPLGYFEDQVQQYLVENLPGKSIADVPYQGYLRAPIYDHLPLGLGEGVTISGGVTDFGSLSDIDNNPTHQQDLTYRYRTSVTSTEPVATTNFDGQWYTQYDLAETNPIAHFTADDSDSSTAELEPYTFHNHGTTKWSIHTNLTAANQLEFQLLENGTVIESDTRSTASTTPHPRLYVEVFAPGQAIPSGTPTTTDLIANSYSSTLLNPDSVYAFGFDVNQYSHEQVESLTEELITKVTTSANGPDDAYEELAQLGLVNYFHRRNRSLENTANITSTRYQLDYGFSVVETATEQSPSVEIRNSETGETTTDLSFAPFGTFPASFAVLDGSTTASFIGLSNSSSVHEASQLANWQVSADQSAIQEELLGTDGSSALRIIQRSYGRQSNYRPNGPDIMEHTDDQISELVVLATRVKNGYAELYEMGTLQNEYGQGAASGGTYNGSFPTQAEIDDQTNHKSLIWRSSTQLSAVDTQAEFNSLQAGLSSAVQAYMSDNTGANRTLKAELPLHFVDSLAYDNSSNTTSFLSGQVLMPINSIRAGGWHGSAILGDRIDSGFGVRLADRFGDDEIDTFESATATEHTAPPITSSKTYPNVSTGGASGNTITEATDLTFPNMGIPLDFSRSYSSRATTTLQEGQSAILRDVGLGVGWTHSFSDRLIRNRIEDDTVTEFVWQRSNGQEHRFTYENGTWVVPAELNGKFGITYFSRHRHISYYNNTQNNYGYIGSTTQPLSPIPLGYEYLDQDGTIYYFDYLSGGAIGSLAGRLGTVVDRRGKGYHVNYIGHTADRIANIRDVNTAGRRLDFNYTKLDATDDNSYRITSITKYTDASANPIGTWEYDYTSIVDPAFGDTRWYLRKVTTPVDGQLIATDSIATEYKYYDHQAPSNEPEVFSGLLNRIEGPNGDYREFEYYLNRRKWKETSSAHLAGLETETTSRTYDYNLVMNSTELVDERGYSTVSFYQSNGNKLKQINPDRTRNVTHWGQVDTNDEYLIQSSTDEVGATETYTYYGTSDGFKEGQLKESVSKRFLMSDGLTVVPGTHLGIITQYDYRQGQAGRNWFPWVQYPRPGSLCDYFPPAGEGVSVTCSKVHTYVYSYHNQHIVDVSTIAIDPGSANDVTTFDYDPGTDLLASVTDARNKETVFTYYATGLLHTEKHPSSSGSDFITTYTYDTAGNVTTSSTSTASGGSIQLNTTEHDHNGQPILVTETGSGIVYESTYDIIGRLHSTRVGDGSGASGEPLGPLPEFESSFIYDASGQLKESTDANGNTTFSQYDKRGNVVKRTNPDGTFVTYKYDNASNLIEQTDELERKTRFAYDNRNRLVQTIHPDGAIDRTYYDGVGRVSAIVDARGNRISYTYDAEGRQLTITNANPIVGENTSTNNYDELGRLTSTQDFNGNYTLFEHDELGRIIETRTLHEGDTPTNITNNPEFVSTTEYDANGNVFRTATYDVDLFLTPTQEGGGGLASFPEDPTALLDSTSPNYLTNGLSLLQVTEIAYDVLDRPIETIYVGASADGAGQSISIRTEYDDDGRVEFTYDELDRKTEYQYDAYGRLEKTIFPDPDGDVGSGQSSPIETRSYDAAGNLISITDANGHATTNAYDVFNRLVSTTDAEGNTTSTVYDVAGQAINTIDALQRSQYMAYDNRGRVRLEHTADPDGDGPLTALTTEFTYDGAGNRTSTIASNGYVNSYGYDELNRLATELKTDAQVYDIAVDHASDPNFTVTAGTPAPMEDTEQSFGRDHIDIAGSSSAPQATWTFDNVSPDETYSVSMTWYGDTSLDSNATATVQVFDSSGSDVTPTATQVTVSQSESPNDYALDYQGQWRGWKQLVKDLMIPADGSRIVITLTGSSVIATIRADAVMFDRQVKRSLAYDGNGNVTSETDVLGRTTTNDYNSRNLLISTTLPDPDGASGSAGPDGTNLAAPVVEQVYDGFGNVIEVVERRGSAADRTQKTTYDRRNQLITTTLNHQDGSYNGGFVDQDIVTKNFYDDAGNLKQITNAAGSPEQTIDSFEYDNLDQLETEHLDIPLSSDKLFDTSVAETNSRLSYGHRNEYQYDPAGNLIRTEFITNDSGDSDEASIVTTFEYDKVNRLVYQVDDVGLINQNVNATSHIIYDAVGNVLQEIDPTGRITTNEYDRLNRLTMTTQPNPETSQAAPSTHYLYDTLGNVARTSNGENETTQSVYDSLNREISRFDANNDETRYRYDAFGNLRSLIDAAGNVTDFQYDDLNRVKTETIYDDNQQPLTRTYIYDNSQNLKRYIDRNNRGIEYTYDGQDRLTTEDWFASNDFSTAEIGTLQSAYDAVGRVTQTRSNVAQFFSNGDLNYVASWEYDNLDRITTQRNYIPSETVLNPRIEQTTTYDQVDNSAPDRPIFGTHVQHFEPEFMVNKEIAQTTYASDRVGRILSIHDEDRDGTTHSISTKDIHYTYDDAGRMLTTQRTSGSFSFDTNYGYDGTGRNDEISHFRDGQTSPFVSYNHTYDSASRIIDRIRNLDTSIAAFTNLNASRNETFDFDDAGQLLERNTSDSIGVDESFTYDENGNRKTANSGDYDTRKNNRVFSDGFYSYRYDGEGNLIQRYRNTDGNSEWSGSEQGTEFRWDHRNRLIEVIQRKGDGSDVTERIHYAYDNDNLRIRKVLQGPTEIDSIEHYVYDGSQVALVINGTWTGNQIHSQGNLAKRYLNGSGVDELLVDEALSGNTANPLWAAVDHLGSVAQLLDGTEAIVEHREYDAFGNILALHDSNGNLEGTAGNPDLAALDSVFAFTGREWDNDAGLYYNRARWYEPESGRFIGEDPAKDGFNLYRYSGNDPVNFHDPTGLFSVESFVSEAIDTFTSFTSSISNSLTSIGSAIGSTFVSIGSAIGSTFASIGSPYSSVGTSFYDTFTSYLSAGTRFHEYLSSITDRTLTSIGSVTESVFATNGSRFESPFTGVDSLFNNIDYAFSNPLKAIAHTSFDVGYKFGQASNEVQKAIDSAITSGVSYFGYPGSNPSVPTFSTNVPDGDYSPVFPIQNENIPSRAFTVPDFVIDKVHRDTQAHLNRFPKSSQFQPSIIVDQSQPGPIYANTTITLGDLQRSVNEEQRELARPSIGADNRPVWQQQRDQQMAFERRFREARSRIWFGSVWNGTGSTDEDLAIVRSYEARRKSSITGLNASERMELALSVLPRGL